MSSLLRNAGWVLGFVGFAVAMLAVAGSIVFVFTFGDCFGDKAVCEAHYAHRRETMAWMLAGLFLLNNALSAWIFGRRFPPSFRGWGHTPPSPH